MESIHNCNSYEKAIVSFIIIDFCLLAILIALTIYVYRGEIYAYPGKMYNYLTGVEDKVEDKVEEDDDEIPQEIMNRIEERRSESNNAGLFSFLDVFSSLITSIPKIIFT
jgi:hypothetical protein